MAKLNGKTIFITGASSGIGAALARRASKEGAAVVLVARRADKLHAIADDLRRAGGRALAVEADVTRDGDLERAAAAGRDAFDGLDVVVANAGFGVLGRIDELELADLRRQFETNVFGVLRTVHATVGDLKRSKGCLVIIGSVLGHMTVPRNGAYAMSKAAVHALAETLKPELVTDGVSVVLIAPGFVETEIRTVDNHGRLREGVRDFVPAWLCMSADRAAAEIIDAIVHGERERVLTLHGKAGVFLAQHAPGLVSAVLDMGEKLSHHKKPH